MIDNQGDPGTVDVTLADGRIDEITSIPQAETQIGNYEATAKQDKGIMDSTADSGTARRDATARYKAAEFDIQQVGYAESTLAAEQPAVSPTGSAASDNTSSSNPSVSPNLNPSMSGGSTSSGPSNMDGGNGNNTAPGVSAVSPTGSAASDNTSSSNPSVSPNLNPSMSGGSTSSGPSNMDGGNGNNTAPSALASQDNNTSSTFSTTIKSGDTLTGLAAKYNTTVPDLMAANKSSISNEDMIYTGRTINIPVDGNAAPVDQVGIGNPNLGGEGGTTYASDAKAPEVAALDNTKKPGIMSRLFQGGAGKSNLS